MYQPSKEILDLELQQFDWIVKLILWFRKKTNIIRRKNEKTKTGRI